MTSGSGFKSPVSKELIARLAMMDTSDDELEVRSIAEASGQPLEVVKAEKHRLEVDARLDRIERLLEQSLEESESEGGELGRIFEFLRNPGKGLTTLAECIGGAIVIATIIFSAAYAITLLRR